MKRRTFLYRLAFGAVAMSPVALLSNKTNGTSADYNIKVVKTQIKAGLKKTLRFLHVSDSHNVPWDNRTPKQEKLAKQRRKSFSKASQYWQMCLDYSKNKNLPILHTGDVFDFYNPASLEFLNSQVMPNVVAYAVGNHELSLKYGTHRDGLPTQEMKDAVSKSTGYDIAFSSRVIDGLNIIAMDNGYYQFTEAQLEKLEAEIKRGLPILILCHIPIYSDEIFEKDFAYKTSKNPKLKVASAVGIPPNQLEKCIASAREARRATATTMKVVSILQNNPLIKGILCGHVHHTLSSVMPSGAVQACIGGGYSGWAQEITIS